MAVLTKSAAIGAAWTEVTAPLGIADAATWSIEVQDDAGTGQGHVVAVWTDANNAPPAGTRGHQYYPRTAAGGPTRRSVTKKAGRYLWMISARGEAMHVVGTPG